MLRQHHRCNFVVLSDGGPEFDVKAERTLKHQVLLVFLSLNSTRALARPPFPTLTRAP